MKYLIASVWLIVLGCGVCRADGPEPSVLPKPAVLIVQSYHPALAWTQQCEEGIRSALGSDTKIRIVYLDTKRVPEAMFHQRADQAWQQYLADKPGLVMLGDDNALRLLGPRFAGTTTPVVYFGINGNPRSYFQGGFPANVTGVLERLPVFPWLRHLKKLMPMATRVLVLMDSSPTSLAIFEGSLNNMGHAKFAGLTITCMIASGWGEWQQVIAAGGYDMVLVPTFHAVKQKDGSHVEYTEVIQWTSRHAGVPLFSYQDYTVGPEGAAGAYVVSGQSHGALAGQIARAILDHRKMPGQMSPQTDWKGTFYFNRFLLDRFGLALPREIEAQAVFQ